MDRQMNVDKSMEENLLEKKLVENMLNLGHRPPDIMAAITSIYACDTDRAQIRRENRTMRLMLFCKSCKINRGTLVNVECGHLLCSNCRNKLNACKFCREEIKEVVAVIFGN